MWFGRDLPGSLKFSQLSWSKARLIVIVNRGSCPVSVYVMVGPQYAVDDADGWTSWIVLTNNHAMPIAPAEHCRFAGESGATTFLRELPAHGVVPVVGTMRDWR